MVKIFPLIFILLWSSAFITTKPIIDNSDPFAALAFRFALVTLGFFMFSLYSKEKILVNRKSFFESFFSGVLFKCVRASLPVSFLIAALAPYCKPACMILPVVAIVTPGPNNAVDCICLLYTSDAADEEG